MSLELDVAARMPVKEEDEAEDNEGYLEKVFWMKLLEMPVVAVEEILLWLTDELIELLDDEEGEEAENYPGGSGRVAPGLAGHLSDIAGTDRGAHSYRMAGVVEEDVAGQGDHQQSVEQYVEVVEVGKTSPFQL